MENILFTLSLLVIILGTANLFRMAIFLIGSDIYTLTHHLKSRRLKQIYFPRISIVIPAFNEEKSIIRCIDSILDNNYPQERIEIIVVNDGSTDKTAQKVKLYKNLLDLENLTLVNQPNSGKSHALNNGMRYYASGELVMCLDSDSFLEKNALRNVVKYFLDKKVVAVATNVKIAKAKGILNLIQQFEYIICYQMKRAQTVFNIEYIIGGIGSTFRRGYIKKINFYDCNTVTEDIDLTMKILRNGNKDLRVIYGADVITYTQSVLNVRDLIKQRYRWKWGRFQTFLKNKSMFFSTDKKYTKKLTWFYLPYAIFNDLAFLLEPIMVGFLLFITIAYHDLMTIISSMVVMSSYFILNILAEDTIAIKNKITLLLLSPLMYILFYILSFVEYVALIKSMLKIHKLQQSLLTRSNNWIPVKRLGYSL